MEERNLLDEVLNHPYRKEVLWSLINGTSFTLYRGMADLLGEDSERLRERITRSVNGFLHELHGLYMAYRRDETPSFFRFIEEGIPYREVVYFLVCTFLSMANQRNGNGSYPATLRDIFMVLYSALRS